jgi:hypothetical protein
MVTSLWCHGKRQIGATLSIAVELRQQSVHVDLAAVRHDRVALESVNVNGVDRYLFAGRCRA